MYTYYICIAYIRGNIVYTNFTSSAGHNIRLFKIKLSPSSYAAKNQAMTRFETF
jgi:hypothetical protein